MLGVVFRAPGGTLCHPKELIYAGQDLKDHCKRHIQISVKTDEIPDRDFGKIKDGDIL
jgi:hypothetical protein